MAMHVFAHHVVVAWLLPGIFTGTAGRVRTLLNPGNSYELYMRNLALFSPSIVTGKKDYTDRYSITNFTSVQHQYFEYDQNLPQFPLFRELQRTDGNAAMTEERPRTRLNQLLKLNCTRPCYTCSYYMASSQHLRSAGRTSSLPRRNLRVHPSVHVRWTRRNVDDLNMNVTQTHRLMWARSRDMITARGV
ncbi:hypothetical protein C8Q73DRAFT_252265 [Cubamyces lactineus]|nr:hypothetical protein C8Q73DRAFT_252265 [Cubamyces lactineus]